MENKMLADYISKKGKIRSRLECFKALDEKECFKEFLFCLLTPQSNAQKCWQAIEQISQLQKFEDKSIFDILRTKTRFHITKTKYILEAPKTWELIKSSLNNQNRKELRNALAEAVKGYGLKEASHFLRNIGKSNNEIAILDRHILRNLKELNVISDDKIKNKKHYFEMEDDFIGFSKKIGIKIDALDLLFWSRENGETFK